VPDDKPSFWYRFALCLIRPTTLLTCRRQWTGQEFLRRDGGIIIAANHLSHADPFTLALYVHESGRRPRLMGKAELWKIPFVRSILVGARQIPVNRQTSDAAAALSPAIAALRAGESVVIYPEGTLTKDPTYWPMTARTGVARLAMLSGSPVIPVAQWGPQNLRRNALRRPWRRTLVQIAAGPPVDLSPWKGKPLSATVLSEVTEAVMKDVTALQAGLRGESPPAVVYDHRAVVGARAVEHDRRSA
jgi:1-acyl-sn-glycerol-3-phosphate acyltransferase